ncbi:MAG: sigma-70 family RNA polymerase sigma factor [Pyrinomonadaceae bacterium]
MTMRSVQDVTGLLLEWQQGDHDALDKLTPLVYDELRRIAHRYMRQERGGHTLQTTALVNEAYVRLVGGQRIEWQNRAHFYGVVAQVMRRVLIDHARRLQNIKHGGDAQRVSLEEIAVLPHARAAELLALDEALNELARLDARKARVVELRYFGGLSIEETADVLDISAMTVRRDWRAAKAWLYRALNDENK